MVSSKSLIMVEEDFLEKIKSNNFEFIKMFCFMLERQSIWHKKTTLKLPREQWTNDEVLGKFFFCNIFRFLDKGTIYLAENVLDEIIMTPEDKILNIIFYRFFNRVDLFALTNGLLSLNTFTLKKYEKLLDEAIGRGEKLYNMAYTLTGKNFTDYRPNEKHIQHLAILESVCEKLKDGWYEDLKSLHSAEEFFMELRKIHNVGNFLAYEIYCDIVRCIPEIVEWTENDFVNIGPGCSWGFDLMLGENLTNDQHIAICYYLRDNQEYFIKEAEKLTGHNWNQITEGIDSELTLRSIEHSGCEYRKYLNVSNGKGRKRYYTSK